MYRLKRRWGGNSQRSCYVLSSISKSTDSSHLSSGLEYFQNIHPVSFFIWMFWFPDDGRAASPAWTPPLIQWWVEGREWSWNWLIRGKLSSNKEQTWLAVGRAQTCPYSTRNLGRLFANANKRYIRLWGETHRTMMFAFNPGASCCACVF